MTLAAAIPVIVDQVIDTIRTVTSMTMLCQNDSSLEPKAQNEDRTLTDITNVNAVDTVPGFIPGVGQTSTPVANPTTLRYNNWPGSNPIITDLDLQRIVAGYENNILQQAVVTTVTEVNRRLLTLAYRAAYQNVGTAGTTPFATSTSVLQSAAAVLTAAGSPPNQNRRSLLVDPFAYGNMMGLGVFQKVNESGSSETLRDGIVSRGLGFMIGQDATTPRHTRGAPATAAIDANATAGATALVLDDGAGADLASLPVAGDLFTIAGQTTQYVVTGVTADSPTANETTIAIQPPLSANVADGAVVTFAATHFANLAFDRHAIVFDSRPQRGLSMIEDNRVKFPVMDPLSGIVLDVEICNHWKQSTLSVTCLFGAVVYRPQHVVRVLG